MACYHPLHAIQVGLTPNGKAALSFEKELVAKYLKHGKETITVPCGQCIGCRLERSRQWAIRCMHEASLHLLEKGGNGNCFLTLTYRDECLHYTTFDADRETGEIMPGVPTLNKRDAVLFMKRLRKKFGDGIRFMQCGEYGDKLNRPHHHFILFNHSFKDRTFYKFNNGFPLYNSKDLERLWPYGHAIVADVTFETCAYVARYVTKKVTGSNSFKHYVLRQPEYITMSRRPGIAREWFERFHTDVFPHDLCVVRSGRKEMKARPPKYYDKLFDLQDSSTFCQIKEKRVNLAKLSKHNSPERLAVREAEQVLKFKKLIRPYENPNQIIV